MLSNRFGMLVCCLAMHAVGLTTTASRTMEHPNIVMIISDDHRWDCIGAAGNPNVHTPNLDALAKDGVHFIQATIASPQCSPSRGVLLTGLPAHQSGWYSNQTHRKDRENRDGFRDLPTLPGQLKEQGYNTVLIGKWHIAADPWNCGFTNVRTWLAGGAGKYTDLPMAVGNTRETTVTKGFVQDVMGNDAVQFIQSEQAKEKPFFLWLALTAPHSPIKPNPAHIEKIYAGKTNRELAPPGFTVGTEAERFTSVTVRGEGAGKKQKQKQNQKQNQNQNQGAAAKKAQRPLGEKTEWSDYYGAITSADEQVGKIRDALKQAGLDKNTIVIFLGDNGLMRGSRGWGGKVLPFDESIRVPILIYAPGIAKISGQSYATVSSHDLPPSILHWAGAKVPAPWAGRDITAVLQKQGSPEFQFSVVEYADNINSKFGKVEYRVVRSPHVKLVRWTDPEKGDQFFDLKKDPRELVNEISNPNYTDSVAALKEKLKVWQERTDDKGGARAAGEVVRNKSDE